ncbi:MAG: DUF1320 domain-containing protein [Planctomycetes bacterium]|nr:DUF1320 domain-containing protein [Planctomycetota bacterium]
MAYVTTTQLSQRLGATLYARLTDRVNGTTADTTVAQQIVAEAEAEADSYLARRYATPVDVSGHAELADVLAARVLDLAEYGAWKSSPFTNRVAARVMDIQAAAVAWLEQVARGELDLPAATVLASPTAQDNGPRFTAETRKFSGDELDGL